MKLHSSWYTSHELDMNQLIYEFSSMMGHANFSKNSKKAEKRGEIKQDRAIRSCLSKKDLY